MELTQLIFELRALQYDYSDCKGNHGPVLQKFTKILNRYQRNFYRWQPLSSEDFEEPESGYSFVSELIFIAIVGVLFYFLCVASQNNFIAAIFYIVAGIAFSVRRDNPVWAVIIIAFNLAFMFVGAVLESNLNNIPKFIFTIALVLYVLASVSKQASDAQVKSEHKSSLNKKSLYLENLDRELSADREKMNQLLPELTKEYKEKIHEIISLSGVDPDAMDWSWCDRLPAVFWWQITPQELENFEATLLKGSEGSVVWETRWINRERGKEFKDAGYEYSPLIEIAETSEEHKKIYDETKDEFLQEDIGAGVFDFISRGTASSMDAETFKYEEYAHSDFSRFSQKMLWACLGNDIDKARKNGQITDEQHAYLSSAYIFASPGVYSNIDEKVEKTGTKYRQVKSFTNIWVGQMLLANDDEADGVAVVDYRCQIPHMFKNIEVLHDVKITRVCGDPLSRNPMVMAKFHKVCELCR